MNPSVRQLLLLAALGHIVALSACSTWDSRKLEASTVDMLDKRLRSQMSLTAFRDEFPDAVLVDGDDGDGSWFVHVRNVCFWCRTAGGFQRSEDVYARIVRFEGGRLAGIDAVSDDR